MPDPSDGSRTSARAVYPGTFDPFTPGHFDIVDRARRLFDHITVLVAVNDAKRPSREPEARALEIAGLLPPGWTNVTVAPWRGLTVDYCHRHNCGVLIRGVRNATDYEHEQALATANEPSGVTTLLLPTRPELSTTSSTIQRSVQSMRSPTSPPDH